MQSWSLEQSRVSSCAHSSLDLCSTWDRYVSVSTCNHWGGRGQRTHSGVAASLHIAVVVAAGVLSIMHILT